MERIIQRRKFLRCRIYHYYFCYLIARSSMRKENGSKNQLCLCITGSVESFSDTSFSITISTIRCIFDQFQVLFTSKADFLVLKFANFSFAFFLVNIQDFTIFILQHPMILIFNNFSQPKSSNNIQRNLAYQVVVQIITEFCTCFALFQGELISTYEN